ncbi:GGDEF domain-containing protein [Paucibacter sediminis]|uniref:diguanylate cyclase n=1 Tax=Paucibacter sediminis TaxID=3019553 RepID=A0AA95NB83_9BURK|nr:GGDEF domain-containing protein [Paucibacter sp. S2-9]WIT10513.1 GGDEF domain-containing protein [Paucibacter sp. S2-9]
MPSTLALDEVLTTLPDRKAMLEQLEQAATQARSSGKVLSLLTLDLDHFKAYQDSQGADAAQAVLLKLADTLSGAIPAGAQLSHLGGDEFVVLLPGHDVLAASAVAEQLRAAVEAAFAGTEGPARLTITLGVAASPAGKDWSARSLLSLADARMTFAKKRLLPHHNLVWAGTLPSDWYTRLDVQAGVWPSV